MSVYVESSHQSNFSQCLSVCENAQSSLLQRAICTAKLWVARSCQRKDLARLDDQMLKDIGLTRRQVHAEISKPFWK